MPGEKDGYTIVPFPKARHIYMDSLTLSFDHDIVDAGPAARFAQRLKGLIESGYGLIEPPSG